MRVAWSSDDCIGVNVAKREAGEEGRKKVEWEGLNGTERCEEKSEEIDGWKRGEDVRSRKGRD